jgi:hypothetical protein
MPGGIILKKSDVDLLILVRLGKGINAIKKGSRLRKVFRSSGD